MLIVFRGLKHSLIVDRENSNNFILVQMVLLQENLLSVTLRYGCQK